MKMSLLSLFGIASWVAIATFAANSGQHLGWLFAVTLATLAALVCGRKAVSAYALAVSAGALGMFAGHFAFLFVIPWPTWVGTETRIALQQFTVEHLVQFTAVWAFYGAIVGLGTATVTLVARHVLMRGPIAVCTATQGLNS